MKINPAYIVAGLAGVSLCVLFAAAYTPKPAQAAPTVQLVDIKHCHIQCMDKMLRKVHNGGGFLSGGSSSSTNDLFTQVDHYCTRFLQNEQCAVDQPNSKMFKNQYYSKYDLLKEEYYE